MAEENKKSGAQTNQLGELFVKFSETGLGNLVKGLNSVSASFLLTKNAAQQFTKPLIDLSKNAAGTITGLDKINAVTGLTLDQLQQM